MARRVDLSVAQTNSLFQEKQNQASAHHRATMLTIIDVV
jgi:hypothetical protein